jgi:hypothetical protein
VDAFLGVKGSPVQIRPSRRVFEKRGELTRLLRVVPVVAVTVIAVAMTAGQVATASSSPRDAKGTANKSDVRRFVAIRPVLQIRADGQLTSGLKSPDAAGYAVTPSTLISAKATIKVPLITCKPSGNSGIAPGVYLIGYFSSYSGVYVFPYCENGRVICDAGITINGAQTIPFTVKPGDTMVVSISETTSKTSATVRDVTAGVTRGPRHLLHWSEWRRRHQHRAKTSHYQRQARRR